MIRAREPGPPDGGGGANVPDGGGVKVPAGGGCRPAGGGIVPGIIPSPGGKVDGQFSP